MNSSKTQAVTGVIEPLYLDCTVPWPICFYADSIVQCQTGINQFNEKKIIDLSIGDIVRAYDFGKRAICETAVTGITKHQNENGFVRLIKMFFQDSEGNEKAFQLSGGHYTFLIREKQPIFVLSQDVQNGDQLVNTTSKGEHKVQVTRVESTFVSVNEIVSVKTETRTMVVDNIVASTLARESENELQDVSGYYLD
ncbi:UNKNOWN [Stylonychia lemnae]|uniref:Hedgehog protein Hint domain-containing protein n=1 Tax=Stylonychia lemnae TaxID=5949 RepID=A0A078B1E9_STYLE|nr:UNKNOWN [Stylonychia lemnae]|eukprot:CDW87033.1 UNKNOWN [Stylonychia lemnae]